MNTVAHAAATSTAPTLDTWRTHLDTALAYCDVHAAASRNGTLCKLAGWLRRRGLDPDDIKGLLLAVNEQLFKKPRAEVFNIARWIKKKPRDGGRRALPDPYVAQLLAAIQAAIEATTWRGRSGKNMRAVLEAHLALAHARHSPLHDASVRLVMQVSGCSYGTVVRCHHRLQRAGWLGLLRLSRRNQDTAGSLWQLQVPPGAGTKSDSVAQSASSIEHVSCATQSTSFPAPGDRLGHPLFADSDGGLGKTVGAILLTLEKAGGFRFLSTWATAAQVDARTIARHLFLLQFTGLVAKKGRCFVRGRATFDEVAAQVGLDKRAETIRRQHAEQREVYRERIAAARNPYQPDRVYVLRQKGLRLVPGARAAP